MNYKIVNRIFSEMNFVEKIEEIEKIKVGFTNELYRVNKRFILKICKKIRNEKNFEKEVFFYDLFGGKLSIPNLVCYDTSKTLINRFFMIYDEIKGENLYARWHLLNDKQRQCIVKKICENLKVINNTDFELFAKRFGIDTSKKRKDLIIGKIKESLKQVKNRKILSEDFLFHINEFIQENSRFLDQKKLGLVYRDVHFDNVLVKDNNFCGMIDFERLEVYSIDYVLSIFKKMVDYPTKFMSEQFEKFAKKEDYEKLLHWIKEFYPELFEFENLDKRIALYELEYDLHTLKDFPNSQKLKQIIADNVGYVL